MVDDLSGNIADTDSECPFARRGWCEPDAPRRGYVVAGGDVEHHRVSQRVVDIGPGRHLEYLEERVRQHIEINLYAVIEVVAISVEGSDGIYRHLSRVRDETGIDSQRRGGVGAGGDAAAGVVVIAVADHRLVPCQQPNLISGVTEAVNEPRPGSCPRIHSQAAHRPRSGVSILGHDGAVEAELSWLYHQIERGPGALSELVGPHSPALDALAGAVPVVHPLVVVTAHLGFADICGDASRGQVEVREPECSLRTVQRDGGAEVGVNLAHRGPDGSSAGLGILREVLDSSPPCGGVGYEALNRGPATELVSEVHQEHETSTVVGYPAVPPPHPEAAVLRPCVGVAGQRVCDPEAEVCGHVGRAFVNPQKLVWVTSAVQQVLELVC